MDTNPHVHFYLVTQTQAASMRVQLRKLCGSGNKGYSLCAIPDDGFPIAYIAYMMKEDKLNCTNIPEEVITEAQEYNTKVVSELKAKKDRLPIWILIAQDYGLENLTEWCGDARSTEDLYKHIISYHKTHSLAIRVNQVIMYYDSIILKYSRQGEFLFYQKVIHLL